MEGENYTQVFGYEACNSGSGDEGIVNTYIGAFADCGASVPNFSMTIGAETTTVEDYSIFIGGSYKNVYSAAPYATNCTGSDRRLKRNITTISGGLNHILGINGVEFN